MAVAFHAAGQALVGYDPSATHTVVADGADCYVLAMGAASTATDKVTSVTCNGVGMTRIRADGLGLTSLVSYVYGLAVGDKTAETQTIVWTFNSSDVGMRPVGRTFKGVNQSSPIAAQNGIANGFQGSPATFPTVSVPAGSMTADYIAINDPARPLTPSTGQTESGTQGNEILHRSAASRESGEAAMSWTFSGGGTLVAAGSVVVLAGVASPPVITGPTGAATGNTTASGTVSTTGTDGTIWRKAQVGAATDPGAGNEAAAGWLSQSVSASGTQTFSSFGPLTTNVSVVANYLHVSAGGLRSSVATSASFTPNTIITGPSGAAGASSSTANLAELATTGPTFSVSETLGGGYPTLTGADAASFTTTTLSSTSFRVEPATPFNFESLPHANPFNITFNASATASQTCAISITNVNEAPTFSGTVSVPSLTEGVAMSAINAATLFSDPDSGDTGTYSAVGTWPTGVTVNSSGLISGTPGAGTAATYSSLRVRRTDGGGLTADSNVFAITVSASGAAPGVTTQPSNQTVTEGGVATFTAAFSNAPTGFAWEFSDSPYSSWSPVVGGSGATTASYTTGALSLANSGRRFRCRGTNAFGSTNTNGTAQVTVNAAPAFSALTDIIAVAGIDQVGVTVYWTWFPSGRPGAATAPVQGSSVTNGSGRALITHSVAGDGMVLLGTRPGPLVSDDRVWLDFLTLA